MRCVLHRGGLAPAPFGFAPALSPALLFINDRTFKRDSGPLAFIDLPEGGRLVNYRDGMMATVSVVEDADGVRRLRINNRQQEGSSATLLSDARQAWIPLLLHAKPRTALFLGLVPG